MIDPDDARLVAAADQWIESSRSVMRIVAEYHAVCVSAGLPARVAEEMTLRFAARIAPLPPRRADSCWDAE